MADMADQRPATAAEGSSDRPVPVAVGALVVMMMLLVPAAFVAGWRARGSLGRMTGY